MSIRRSAHVAWRRLGDETIVIDLNGKRVYCLNAGGGALWSELDRPQELPATDDGTVSDDVAAALAFVEELRSCGLVEDAGEGSERLTTRGTPTLPPPAVVWSEPLLTFTGACGKYAGGGEPCNSYPENS